MPSIEVLLAFTTAALIMNISPGPSNLYVMARAIAQGTSGGAVAAAGLAAGSLFHVVATVFGLSAIFQHSPTLYLLVKIIGAAYLIYLGISYWRSSSEQTKTEIIDAKDLKDVFRESVIVEVTNPKTALFFIAFLPQFVDPSMGSVTQQLAIFGIIVTLSALPCDLLVAFSANRVAKWLIKNKQAQVIQNRVSGSILLGMGTYIAVKEAFNLSGP
ncbi:MAG: LysE family translocator [Pseudomonadales bacterium]|nr:LysE family translocator [Pseudomonadales bacterium]